MGAVETETTMAYSSTIPILRLPGLGCTFARFSFADPQETVMKSRLLFFAIPAAIMLTACQPATTELTEEQKAAIEDTIQQLNTELTVAMNARDFDSWLLSLSDDIRWGFPYGYSSHADIEGTLRSMLDAATDTEWGLDWDETFVRVLGPDAAVLWGTYTLRGSDGAQIHATQVYARVDGEWKIVHGHSTVAAPPPEAG